MQQRRLGCLGTVVAMAVLVAIATATPVLEWVAYGIGSEDAIGQAVTRNPAGDVIVAGSFLGDMSVEANSSPLFDFHSELSEDTTYFGFGELFVVQLADDETPQWSVQSETTPLNHHYNGMRVEALGTLPNNDVVVGGMYAGKTKIGTVPLEAPNDGQGVDVFVAVLDAVEGHTVSVITWNNSWSWGGMGMTVDDDGNVYVARGFSGAAYPASGTGEASPVVRCPSDMATCSLIVQYSQEAKLGWTVVGIPKESHHWVETTDLVVVPGADGRVYVVGSMQGCVSFDHSGTWTCTNLKNGAYDEGVFLADFTTAGEFKASLVWTTGVNSRTDRGTHIACHPATGDLFIAGSFRGQVTFGGTTLSSTGSIDMFLVHIQQLEVQWAEAVGSPLADTPGALAVAPSGESVVLGGVVMGSVTVHGTLLNVSTGLVLTQYETASAAMQWAVAHADVGHVGGISFNPAPARLPETLALTGGFLDPDTGVFDALLFSYADWSGAAPPPPPAPVVPDHFPHEPHSRTGLVVGILAGLLLVCGVVGCAWLYVKYEHGGIPGAKHRPLLDAPAATGEGNGGLNPVDASSAYGAVL